MRGLGILNIKDLFGVTAIRERKRIDVVVRLAEWSKDTEYDRLGRSAFLASYFGLSLATIIKRAIAGEPIEVMQSSPHEREAYALEKRYIAHPG